MKVVINTDFGGFGLSDEAIQLYSDLSKANLVKGDHKMYYYDGDEERPFMEWEMPRDDEFLVQVVEKLGEDANGLYSDLKVVEIPDDVNWYIEEFDGREHVAERHRTWS